ncbi:hypothetical protein EXS70_01415 [Candidatus Peribacteria bacterium]|nr:hypothetical protein [Candidatus Peribacteria bacterium]
MAKRRSSAHPLHLITEAWLFLRKQPALFHVLVWFLILPVVIMDLLTAYWPVSEAQAIDQIGDIGYVLASILLTFVTFWGFACVLLVGRRMVVNRAGRSRTSFRAVRNDSARMIFPLFFTSLLRSVITLEWAMLAVIPAVLFLLGSQECRATFSPAFSAAGTYFQGGGGSMPILFSSFFVRCSPLFLTLPLLVPALIYQLRTAFYGIVLTSSDLRYRDALRKSSAVVRGKSWRIFWTLLAMGLLLLIPSLILGGLVSFIQYSALPGLDIISVIFSDVIYACSGLLFTLALVAYYGKLHKEKGRVEEVVSDLL